MVLEVVASMAGVQAPCPGCGQSIAAPPQATPRAIAIKPRVIKAPRSDPKSGAAPAAGSVMPAPLPAGVMPASPSQMTAPAPSPGRTATPVHPVANPPVPRRAPIPALPAKAKSAADPGRFRMGGEDSGSLRPRDDSSPPRQRENSHPPRPLRREARNKPGRAVNPVTGMSEVYQDRKNVFAILKILAAILVTSAIALGVVVVIKRGLARPTYEQRP